MLDVSQLGVALSTCLSQYSVVRANDTSSFQSSMQVWVVTGSDVKVHSSNKREIQNSFMSELVYNEGTNLKYLQKYLFLAS